jgi:hypothetical protein
MAPRLHRPKVPKEIALNACSRELWLEKVVIRRGIVLEAVIEYWSADTCMLTVLCFECLAVSMSKS